MSKCFFPGSFDPFTFGHQNIIKKVSTITDHLVVGIGNHHDKNSLLDIKIREKLIRESVDALVIKNLKIDIVQFDCLLIDAAKKNNAEN